MATLSDIAQASHASAFSNGKDQIISNASVINATRDVVFQNIQLGAPQSNAPQTTPESPFLYILFAVMMSFHIRSLLEASGGKLLQESVSDTNVDDDDDDDNQSVRSFDSDATCVVMLTAEDLKTPDYKKAFIPSDTFNRGSSSCKTYVEHMLKPRLGYPIWLPQPDRNLPVEHRRKGISTGDFGIITPDGGFDHLLNIWDDLPDDFDSMPRPKKRVSLIPLFSPGGSTVSSLDTDMSINTKTNDICYTCNDGNRGAILSLPDGASIETLNNEGDLKEFIERIALKLCRHASLIRGCDLHLSSLYVVTGCVKSKTWGIATFDTAVQERQASLVIGESRNVNRPSYIWKQSRGVTTTRSGPSPDPGLIPENEMQSDIENQNLFLRGYMISLREKVWNDIREPVGVAVEDKSGEKPFGPDQSYEPNSRKETRNDENGSGMHSSSPTSFCHNISISNFPANHTLFHPLNAINDMLLSKFPEARVAITHDNLWCEVANQGDYDAVRLQKTVQDNYVVDYCEETGACILKPRLDPLIASEGVDPFHECTNRAIIPEPVLALTQRATDKSNLYLLNEPTLLGKIPLYRIPERDGNILISPTASRSAVVIPTMKDFIMAQLAEDKAVLMHSMEVQMQKLGVEPRAQVIAQLGCVKSLSLEFVVDSQPDATLHNQGSNDSPIANIHQGETGFSQIERTACLGAYYQSENRLKCHPGTREAVISDIMSWVTSKIPPERITWLNGPAGAGKLSVAQTIAELCHSDNKLIASFFFSRTACGTGRDNGNRLVPTIAYQLAIAVPAVKDIIMSQLKRDKVIPTCSMEVQMQKLVVEPLAQVEAQLDYAKSPNPNLAAESQLDTALHSGWTNSAPIAELIIIDALDECNVSKMQLEVVKAIVDILSQTPMHLRFLITSRPELETRIAFNSATVKGICTHLTPGDTYSPDQGIGMYLRREFTNLKQERTIAVHLCKESSLWPSDKDIGILLQRAAEQLTAIKFHHCSFTDFLKDHGRTREFSVNTVNAHNTLGHYCLVNADDVCKSELTTLKWEHMIAVHLCKESFLWPSDKDIDILFHKSFEQFIKNDCQDPRERLRQLIDARTKGVKKESPYEQLNSLYRFNLCNAVDKAGGYNSILGPCLKLNKELNPDQGFFRSICQMPPELGYHRIGFIWRAIYDNMIFKGSFFGESVRNITDYMLGHCNRNLVMKNPDILMVSDIMNSIAYMHRKHFVLIKGANFTLSQSSDQALSTDFGLMTKQHEVWFSGCHSDVVGGTMPEFFVPEIFSSAKILISIYVTRPLSLTEIEKKILLRLKSVSPEFWDVTKQCWSETESSQEPPSVGHIVEVPEDSQSVYTQCAIQLNSEIIEDGTFKEGARAGEKRRRD